MTRLVLALFVSLAVACGGEVECPPDAPPPAVECVQIQAYRVHCSPYGRPDARVCSGEPDAESACVQRVMPDGETVWCCLPQVGVL